MIVFDRKIQLRKRETIKLCILGCKIYHEILRTYIQSVMDRNQIDDIEVIHKAKRQLRSIRRAA